MDAVFLIVLGLVCISLFLLYWKEEGTHATIWSLYHEFQQESLGSHIYVQATPDMTAAQLADLLREAEAILQAEAAVTSSQS